MYVFVCVLVTMLEDKKPQSSQHQGSADAGRPKTQRNNAGTRNSAASKTDHVSNGSNAINAPRRFSLLSEHCATSPAPGPLTSPLLGGLPGSSLLIGQQAASLRLAQLKAQLALTQINNVLAVSSRPSTFTANPNTPARYIPTTPPSPTAAAINLLNLLKIANTMSHPLYNPYASGNQSSTQGQYGRPSLQAETDPRRTSSGFGPGSSFTSSVTSSVNPDNSGAMHSSLMSQSINYRPEQSRAMRDQDLERSVDMHISQARQEVRLHSKASSHQPVDQSTHFTGHQRDELRSSGSGMASYPLSSTSASLEHRHSNTERGSSSLDWSANYKRRTADDSEFYSASASSNYASCGSSRYNASSEREHEMQCIPGLGDNDYPVPSKPVTSSEPSRPKYTSESAANILLRFGLEKEDLEQLISFPEDQITPANLPFILRTIRIQKEKRATTAAQSKPYPEPQSTRSSSQMDNQSLSSSGGAGMRQEGMSSVVLQPSKVIDYGHTGKYSGKVGDEMGRTSDSRANSGGSGSMLLMDTLSSSRPSRETLKTNETKSSALSSSHEQTDSITSLSSSYSSVLKPVAAPSHNQTKRLQTQPNQASQTILSSLSQPKKDTDIRVIKSEASTPIPSKEPGADRQSTLKTQPSCTLFRGVHPSRPGLVLIGSNDNIGTKDQSKTQRQGTTVAEQMRKQQTWQHIQRQSVQQKPGMEQQPGQAMWPPVFSAAKSLPPTVLIPTITDSSRAMQPPVFIPGDPRPIVVPPALPQPLPSLMSFNHMTLPTSNRQPPAKVVVSKGLPTLAMMHDYAAASPRIFPHTCSLCNKECTLVKDWISHQNTSLHLDSCKRLRKQYPEWDGEIALVPRATGKDAKPSSSASAQTSQRRPQKTRHGSRSRSHSSSPRRHHGTEDRRAKHRSRSQSPQSSRYTRRSRSRSRSPWYDRPTSSSYRSHSKSPERRLSPRRRDEKRSSPRRNDERRLPLRRRSPARRSDERRSPPRRSGERRLPPRRSHDRQSSTERSSPQQKKSNNAERLAKKLLETSAVQSLSKQSDLAAVVKTLAPALLAELAKMKSSSSSGSSKGPLSAGVKRSSSTASSSSSSSTAKKKDLTTKPSKTKPSLSEASSSTKTKSGKPSPPTMVRLQGIHSSISHNDVLAAVKHFGKTKSVVLFRSKLEAIVCFEKVEDAKKLRSMNSLDVKGLAITVVTEKETVSKEQKKLLQKKPATPSVSTSQTTKFATATTTRKVLLPTPNIPPLKGRVPSGSTKAGKQAKLPNQKTAAVTKSKVLVSKAKNVSTKQIAKTVKTGKLPAKGALKKVAVKKKTSSGSKSATSTSLTSVKESVVVLKETNEFDKSATRTVNKSTDSKEIVTEGKVVASKAEPAATMQKPEALAVELAAAGVVTKEKAKETPVKAVSVPSKSTSSENRPDEENSKPKESKTKVEETVVMQKETAEVDKSTSSTDNKPTKVKEIATEAKVTASKAEPAATTQKPKTPAIELVTAGVETKIKVVETAAKAVSVPPKSTASGNRPDVEKSENMVQEAAVVLKKTVKITEMANVTAFQPEHQEELDKASDAEGTEPMELEEMGVKDAQPMEVGSCDDDKRKEKTTAEAVPEYPAEKPSESQTQTRSVETPPTETPIKTVPNLQQQAAGKPSKTTVDAKLPVHDVETKTMQKVPVTAVQTQANAASPKDSSVPTEPTVAGVSEQQPNASMPSSTAADTLTIGERVGVLLRREKICCLKWRTCLSSEFVKLGKKLMLITGLPVYHDGCYTEDDVAKLLMQFGFQYTDDSIYVVPQTCMAFFNMPTVEMVHCIMKNTVRKGIHFKGSKLSFHVVNSGITMTPCGFYKSMKKLMGSGDKDDGVTTVFINNISPSEASELKETAKKICRVKNYLPLLNKVFVEFDSIDDADRLGVWYSLLKKAPGPEVHRLKIPCSGSTSLHTSLLKDPKRPENTLPDRMNVVAGLTIPPINVDIPSGSDSPFWITMRANPFLFPTGCPCFIIPDYLTVRTKNDIEKASGCGSMFHTVMLTGLPGGNYRHEAVAKLVWRYLPKKNIHSLYYNVIVLTLQRRAFVFFSDWTRCCDFVQDHITNPVSVKGNKLSVHFVLQDMNPESSEEMMYKTLTKWSNAGVPGPESLEERLLCVETSETSVDVIRMVIEVVASIATFVNFLPLANRICIEMADSSGVTQVLEKYNTFSPNSFKKRAVWIKVKRFETLKSLKQRLQAESDIRINLEPKTSSAEASAPVVKCQTQPPLSEPSDNGPQPALQIRGPGGSTKCQPLAAGPSATTSSNVAIDNMEKPGTEIALDSTVGPVSNDDAENVKVKREEGSTADVTSAVSSEYTVPVASCPAASSTAFTRKEHFAELPQIDEDIFKALTAAVRQHRLTRGSGSEREKRIFSKNSTSSKNVLAKPQRMSQDDFTDDALSSDAYLFEGPDFNMDDFVTVDEVGDDMEDTIPESHSSSSPSSRVRRERQSSGVSSGGKHSSTRSPKESKSSASSSLKSTKGLSTSNSSSASTEKSIHSSEPIRSPTKPLSSASVSKPSSSSPLSTEIPLSPGQKTQESKKKSPSKASNTPSSHCSTRSSSSACERERITSATIVKESIETPLEPQREGIKATESAGSKSDNNVSAEGIAAKTNESETKIETSEIQSPPQGYGVELSQAKLETSKEVQKEDDVEKHTEEEEDDGEVFQILDSVDDQTDELMHDEDQDGTPKSLFTGPDEGNSLEEESYQVLDSVDDEGKTCPEEHSNMEMDSCVQVLDSISEDQTATSQEDDELVRDNDSTVKQMSEEDISPAVDKSGCKFAIKDAEGEGQQSNKVNFRLHIGSKQAPMGEEDEKKTNQNEEVIGKFGQIPNEDAALQDCERDSLKDPDSDIHEQEAFEILDSVDEQTATEDDNQNWQRETPSDQICKDHIGHMEDEEDTYQVIDSVEDQPTAKETKLETIKKEQRTKKGEVTARRDNRPSTRSHPTPTASKTEEKEKSPKKQDRTVRKYETRTKTDTNAGVSKKDKEINKEMVFEILDSVEDKPVQDTSATERSGRRRSARGKKEDKTLTEVSQKPVRDEEATYEILDSVEDETADVEPTITTRSTRGRKERRSLKDASNETTKKEDTPTRRRHTPARDAQERIRAKTPKKEVEVPPKESTPTKKSDIVVREVNEKDGTHEDSVEVKDNWPTTGGKGKRGRPKKEVTSAIKDHIILKKGDSETFAKVADEDEATYQILDSVEDETVDDQPPTGQMESSRRENISKNNDKQTESSAYPAVLSKNEDEEEEPMYQIVDSVEDDQEELIATEVSDTGRTEKRNSTKEDASAEEEDTQKCGGTVVEESKKEVVTEEPMTAKPEEEKKQKSPENSANTLANLDEVSEEEEDYPDDTAEEEELRKKQATSKKKLQEREARRTMERGQQSQSSSSGIRGGSDRERTWRARENEEKVEINKQLVTLDEVEADEAEEERGPESQEWDREIMEGELQTLVTLDEFIEEDEDGKSEESMLKAHRNSQEDESLDSLNPETLVTVDEACGDEEEKRNEEHPEKTSKSAKRKHDDDTEESMNFVTVDEVGEVDEEEEKEAATLRTKGRAQKRNRQTPVRKSSRGKKVNTNNKGEEEKEQTNVLPPTSLDASSSLSAESQLEVQRTDVEAESQADDDAHSAGQELRSEDPENQTLEKCGEERWSRVDVKVVSKQRRELVGPEAKRSRSQSPCVAADFKLPAFKPNNPLGQEFVVPKSGYFCNLCSLFYLTESTAKNRHCSSQRHYDNLQKHYQKLEQKPSRSSTQSSHGSVSD